MTAMGQKRSLVSIRSIRFAPIAGHPPGAPHPRSGDLSNIDPVSTTRFRGVEALVSGQEQLVETCLVNEDRASNAYREASARCPDREVYLLN